MSTININGRSYSGNNVSVVNGRVFVDGKDVTDQPGAESKVINIAINGKVDSLHVDACEKVAVIGTVGDLQTKSGDINIEGDVAGNVTTQSGDVDCYDIHGDVQTQSGDIKHKKK